MVSRALTLEVLPDKGREALRTRCHESKIDTHIHYGKRHLAGIAALPNLPLAPRSLRVVQDWKGEIGNV